MALSLESIFHPFNAFFVDKFGAADAPVKFRFARTPRSFVDSDFLTPLHPEWGASQALALEIFSNVVDGVAKLDADGCNVWIGPHSISELYGDEMLGPAISFVPPEVSSDADRQAMIDAFNQLKHDARERWEATRAASLMEGAQGTEYHPSSPAPAMWWDKSAAGVWTPQAFQVAQAGTPAPPGNNGAGILKLKIDDVRMRTLLDTHLQAMPVAPVANHPMPVLSPGTRIMARPIAAAAVMSAQAETPVRMAGRIASIASIAAQSPVAFAAPAASALANPALHDVAIHTNLANQISVLPFKERMEIQDVLAQNAPTQPVGSTNVGISFDFCVVNIVRPWLHHAFLDSRAWYIPGLRKGELSANDAHGLPALPVGFVAVKNLRIQARWTPEDILNLERSIQFGPFNFDSTVVDGAISHDGIQIVGWLLQDLADLPPNAAQ
jgi:hypothetical protein